MKNQGNIKNKHVQFKKNTNFTEQYQQQKKELIFRVAPFSKPQNDNNNNSLCGFQKGATLKISFFVVVLFCKMSVLFKCDDCMWLMSEGGKNSDK